MQMNGMVGGMVCRWKWRFGGNDKRCGEILKISTTRHSHRDHHHHIQHPSCSATTTTATHKVFSIKRKKKRKSFFLKKMSGRLVFGEWKKVMVQLFSVFLHRYCQPSLPFSLSTDQIRSEKTQCILLWCNLYIFFHSATHWQYTSTKSELCPFVLDTQIPIISVWYTLDSQSAVYWRPCIGMKFF